MRIGTEVGEITACVEIPGVADPEGRAAEGRVWVRNKPLTTTRFAIRSNGADSDGSPLIRA